MILTPNQQQELRELSLKHKLSLHRICTNVIVDEELIGDLTHHFVNEEEQGLDCSKERCLEDMLNDLTSKRDFKHDPLKTYIYTGVNYTTVLNDDQIKCVYGFTDDIDNAINGIIKFPQLNHPKNKLALVTYDNINMLIDSAYQAVQHPFDRSDILTTKEIIALMNVL